MSRPLSALTPTGALVTCYLVAIALTAWLRLDTAWDSLAYHLPFAAIRAGIVTHADYIIPANHVALLNGFPPLIDLAKGFLWRFTGRPEATQLFNLIVVVGGGLILSSLYRLPLAALILAVLAIPVGQIEFAGNYTDLPVNFLLAFALFSVGHSALRPTDHKLRHTAATAAVLCVATMMKVTAIPFGIVIWALYIGIAAFGGAPSARSSLMQLRRTRPWVFLGFAFMGGLLAVGYGLVNFIIMGNPLFPVPVDLGFISLPGTVPVSNWAAAPYLEDVSRPLRWLVSVSEWHAFDFRPLPYIVAQGDVPESAMSYRMGGLFAYQLMFTVACLLVAKNEAATRKPMVVLALHSALAAVVSMVPGSHEMRYFFFWYLSLLWTALFVLRQGDDRAIYRLFVSSISISAIYITLITGASYVYPFKDSPDSHQLTQGAIRAEVWGHLRNGERRFCVADKGPLAFLYSEPFHKDLASGGSYQVSADSTSIVCSKQLPGE